MAGFFLLRTERIVHIVAPLVEVLVRNQYAAASEADCREVQRYVLATLEAMPDHVRTGFVALAWLFEYTPLPRRAARFSRLDDGQRKAQVMRWRHSRIGFRRSMIAFYATFSAYGLFSLAYPVEPAEHGRIAA